MNNSEIDWKRFGERVPAGCRVIIRAGFERKYHGILLETYPYRVDEYQMEQPPDENRPAPIPMTLRVQEFDPVLRWERPGDTPSEVFPQLMTYLIDGTWKTFKEVMA